MFVNFPVGVFICVLDGTKNCLSKEEAFGWSDMAGLSLKMMILSCEGEFFPFK